MKLKTGFSPEDFKLIRKAIVRHFRYRNVSTKDGTMYVTNLKSAETLLGLPYTSSSSCAGLWITNTEVYLDIHKKWHYQGFAITEGGTPVAIIWDYSMPEQEIIIKL